MTTENILKQIKEILGVQFSEIEKQETKVELADVATDVVPQTDTKAEDKPDFEKQITDLNTRLTALEDTIKQLVGDVAMSKDANTKLSAIVKTISEMPISEPLKRTETLSAIEKPDYSRFLSKKIRQ